MGFSMILAGFYREISANVLKRTQSKIVQQFSAHKINIHSSLKLSVTQGCKLNLHFYKLFSMHPIDPCKMKGRTSPTIHNEEFFLYINHI